MFDGSDRTGETRDDALLRVARVGSLSWLLGLAFAVMHAHPK